MKHEYRVLIIKGKPFLQRSKKAYGECNDASDWVFVCEDEDSQRLGGSYHPEMGNDFGIIEIIYPIQ